jgi:hypothetical protein
MKTTSSKQKPRKAAAPTKTATTKAGSRNSAKPAVAKATSKHDTILALLRKPSGATIASLTKATGWQTHSIRGFFSGTVRKKLNLNLTSEEKNGERRYRIAGTQS